MDQNHIISGESGLVYRGYIDRGAGRELVAVKTGKGTYNPPSNVIMFNYNSYTQPSLY